MSDVVHENVLCSQCKKCPITGVRYMCLTCQEFNLCSECEKIHGAKHGHSLLVLRNPQRLNLFKQFNEKLDEKSVKKGFFGNSAEYIKGLVYGKELNFKCRNKTLTFNTRNNNNSYVLEIVLENNGRKEWPTPCFLSPIVEKSDVIGKKVKLTNTNIKVGEILKCKIEIDLDKIKKTGNYKSFWNLTNEKGVPFGPVINIVIRNLFDNKLKFFQTLEGKKEELQKGFFGNSLDYLKGLVYEKGLDFKCRNKKLTFNTRNNNNSFTVELKLENIGTRDWPEICYLAPVSEKSQVIGKKVKLFCKEISKGKFVKEKIKIDLGGVNKTGIYKTVWKLTNEKNVAFGPEINIVIRDLFDRQLKLNPIYMHKGGEDKIIDSKKELKGFFGNSLEYIKELVYGKEYDFYIRNKNLSFKTKNNNNSYVVDITFENKGKKEFPTPCFLNPIKSKSQVIGPKVKIYSEGIKMGKLVNAKIRLDLSNIKESGIYNSSWNLCNEKGVPFGPIINISIQDIFDDKLKVFLKPIENVIKPMTVDDYLASKGIKAEPKDFRFNLENMVDEIKNEYDILFNKDQIRNALIKTKGNKENSIKILFNEKEKRTYYKK